MIVVVTITNSLPAQQWTPLSHDLRPSLPESVSCALERDGKTPLRQDTACRSQSHRALLRSRHDLRRRTGFFAGLGPSSASSEALGLGQAPHQRHPNQVPQTTYGVNGKCSYTRGLGQVCVPSRGSGAEVRSHRKCPDRTCRVREIAAGIRVTSAHAKRRSRSNRERGARAKRGFSFHRATLRRFAQDQFSTPDPGFLLLPQLSPGGTGSA